MLVMLVVLIAESGKRNKKELGVT